MPNDQYKRNVFIITRCTDLACKESAYLVFKTIRTGFPTANIHCIYLGDYSEVRQIVEDECVKLNVKFDLHEMRFQTNDQVIEWLVQQEQKDFVVVDSDCVFHSSLEWYNPIQLVAGRHIPEHVEDASGQALLTMERLHTSLMYFSRLPELRQKIGDSFEDFSGGRFAPYNVFRPVVTKQRGQSIFYDSCSILYGAIGGEAFGKDVLDCYDHLHAGSFYNKLVEAKPSLDVNLWQGAFSNPASLKGIHKKQRVYWYKSAFKSMEEKFCSRLSEDAIRFLHGYGNYVALIDDLIDEPNNPERVSKTTAAASKLFSSNFWTKYSYELRVIEQLVHVIYFSSLEWEKSSEAWKRRDARVLSHCGYHLIIAVFILETGDMDAAKEFALEMLEKNHIEHMEDLTTEEQAA